MVRTLVLHTINFNLTPSTPNSPQSSDKNDFLSTEPRASLQALSTSGVALKQTKKKKKKAKHKHKDKSISEVKIFKQHIWNINVFNSHSNCKIKNSIDPQ